MLQQLSHKDSRFSSVATVTEGLSKKEKIQKVLQEYHKKYYSANQMNLVISGKASIQTLEELTTKLFADIPNTNVQQTDYSQPRLPFDKDNLGMLVHLIPEQDVEILDINWILPCSEKEFLTEPLEYFKHAFSHHGPNSLLRHLKTEGLARAISCSYDHYLGLFTVFSL